jgi:bifunctional non-homologous end joining protein LigD
MLLASGDAPRDARWTLEVKLDGIRGQVRVVDGEVTVRSRPGRLITDEFPELAALAGHLRGRDVILDGEITCLDEHGRPDFSQVRNRLIGTRGARGGLLRFYAFDVLCLDGDSLLRAPYSERREALATLGLDDPHWQTVPTYCAAEHDLAAVTLAHGLEGIVAKRLDAPYRPGTRSRLWLKKKHMREERFVVSGWRPAQEVGDLDTFYLARVTGGRWRPAGSVEHGPGSVRAKLRSAAEVAATGTTRRGIRNLRDGIYATVAHHGAPDGPVRDAVLREAGAPQAAVPPRAA